MTALMMLGRTKYDDADGHETELLASLLQRRIIDRWLRSDESSGARADSGRASWCPRNRCTNS
ncbi:hypothetical protein [Streptomyces canus]|uniref:hypothetical protein n=1 Tax=Streptomyces canus TaxID=58343 RepID=UPI002E3185DC|nr:hypothetical protein [Streptomyces canus]